MNILVFDTEAAGRAPGLICQLAYIMADPGRDTGKNMFFAVDSMSAEAQAVHSLSLDALQELSGGVRFADRAEEICRDFAQADLLVGHNISADIRHLCAALEQAGRPWPEKKTFCTMNHFTPILKLKRPRGPGSPKPPKLSELCAHYGLSDDFISDMCEKWFGAGSHAHDARFDAAATYLCWKEGVLRGDILPQTI